MTTAAETLTAICKGLVPGVRFPTWAVPTRSGHLIGLVSHVPADPHRQWLLQQTVSRSTFAALLDADLIEHGEPEPVPEYGRSRPGLGWESERVGWRLALTAAGRAVAGCWLPRNDDDAPSPSG